MVGGQTRLVLPAHAKGLPNHAAPPALSGRMQFADSGRAAAEAVMHTSLMAAEAG